VPVRLVRRCALTALSALLLGTLSWGCSSDHTAGGRANCSTTAPGVTADEIRVGLIIPDTGQIASAFSSTRAAVLARVAAANAAGGVNGRRIVVDWRDDESSPTGNLVAARDLVDRQGIFGLVELTAEARGSADYLAAGGIPVTGLAAEQAWAQHRNMFATMYNNVEQPNTTFGEFAARAGGTRALLIREDVNAASTAAGDGLSASLAAQHIPVVATVNHTAGFVSPAQIAAAAKAAKADVIASSGTADVLASALQAIRAGGGEVRAALAMQGYELSLLRTYGSSIAGLAVALVSNPLAPPSAALIRYRATMNRYAPEVSVTDESIKQESYIAADLFLRGLAEAGPCPTRAGFVNGLRQVENYDADGLLADPVNLGTNIGRVNQCRYFVRVAQSGQAFEVVPGGDGRDKLEWCPQGSNG
jgi:ABC-type branched-subunit amino acid transport system substrate-binding protein